MSFAELLRVQAKLFGKPAYDMSAFTMVNDGIVFTEAPIGAIERNPLSSVPLLIGTNSEEMRYWTAVDATPIDRQSLDGLKRRLVRLFGQPGADLIASYQKYSASDSEAASTLIGDAIVRIPALRLADVNSARQPTYVYLFTFRSTARGPTGLEYGAMHGLEVAPVFRLDTPAGYTYVGPKGSWSVLSDQMLAAWTNFARTGDPNNSRMPPWARYEKNQRATMALGSHSDLMLDPYGEERKAWTGIPTELLQNVDVAALSELLED
jgi:para-nitrobenzyl esterase